MKYNFKKKAIKWTTLIVSLTVITLFACKRTAEVQVNDETFSVAQAKEWYYREFKKSPYFNKLNEKSPFTTNALNNALAKTATNSGYDLTKYPKWSLGQAYTKNGFQIVEMPILYSTTTVLLPGTENESETTKKQLANTALKKVLFIKQPNGKVAIRLVTIVPTKVYAASKNFDISSNNCNNLNDNFSGYIMVRKWDETPITTTKIVNGTNYQKIVFAKRKANGTFNIINNQNSSREQTETENSDDCMVWVPKVYKTCAYFVNPDEPEEECEDWNETESPTEGTWQYNPDCMGDGGELSDDELCLLFDIGCPGDEMQDPCEMYGICGGGGEGVDCNALEQEYREKFDNYVSLETESSLSFNGPSSIAGSNPIVGRIPWTVAASSFNFWRVEAFSDYEYYKTSYMVISPSGALVNQDEYNITKFESFGSHFKGTHTLFESTWTQIGPALTQILNNNSSNAKAKSRISGTIRHKSRTALSIATCGTALFLDVESTIPGNELTFKPL
ncbi:MAG: hypothetical protein MUE72_01715 [Chitinophagaceae bacterium]|jgi:hypothetical protein|nr:hypothetical protein [Chitinophagaceae bacterium]